MKIEDLIKEKDWKEFKDKASLGNQLIIFKFSPLCGTSLYAEKVFEKWASGLKESVKIKLSKINVVSARQLSRQIATEVNVIHESPQLIWLNTDLSVKWNASHHEINKEKLDKNLSIFN